MVDEEIHLDDWIPTTEAGRKAVHSQLERMLESPLFSNSKRYPNLLRFMVEQALAGNEALLKERTLGVAVFHRAPDYDTNQDTVVRLTASEVRKRIAQYYHQPEHAGELQIDLRAGSYVPVFRRAEALHTNGHMDSVELLAASAADTQSATAGMDLPAEKAAGVHPALLRLVAGIAAVVVCAAVLLGWYASQAAHSASRQLWAPILNEPGQVQLVLADLSATLSHTSDLRGRQAVELLDLLRMGEMVNYRDSLAQSGIVAFLAKNNKPYALELSTQASYPDLQRGASVLVGGLDNVWTLRVTDPLRFHLVRRGNSYMYGIVDRQHPEQGGWNVDMAQTPDHANEDYAIVARIFDQTTGRPVLVVAGLGANGTTAAAQFLLDPARTAELTAHSPRNWQRLNMEAVIRTQILDNHAGPPHLVDCTFW
jgi:hypothetical protein